VLSSLSADVVILLLRVAVVLTLYLFLFTVVAVILRELRVESQSQARRHTGGHLVVADPGTAALMVGETVALEPVTRIGRSKDNLLVLDDDFVSASHAILLLRDGRWWARDAGSTNGTRVNDTPIQEETALQNGDEIHIGGVVLRVVL
jgi:hypothetical protein